MTSEHAKKPAALDDAALEDVTGGAETVHLYLQANGEAVDPAYNVYAQITANGTAVENDMTRTAGLRSDGELVQAVSDKTYKGS